MTSGCFYAMKKNTRTIKKTLETSGLYISNIFFPQITYAQNIVDLLQANDYFHCQSISQSINPYIT